MCTGPCHYDGSLDNVPDWFKENEYCYFTMSNVNDSTFIWMMSLDGSFNQAPGFPCSLKPVIRLYKSALTDIDPEPSYKDVNNNEKSDVVKTPDTLQVVSMVFTMIGVVIISIVLFMVIIIKNRESAK